MVAVAGVGLGFRTEAGSSVEVLLLQLFHRIWYRHADHWFQATQSSIAVILDIKRRTPLLEKRHIKSEKERIFNLFLLDIGKKKKIKLKGENLICVESDSKPSFDDIKFLPPLKNVNHSFNSFFIFKRLKHEMFCYTTRLKIPFNIKRKAIW